MSLFSFLNTQNKELKEWQKIVTRINKLEKDFEAKSDGEIESLTPIFKERLKNGEVLDSLLPEAFAAVREAAKRSLGQRHFDVQLLGAMALNKGAIAQMMTGEGKTLAATAAVYLNALEGKGVHVVTVNDYLARRDTVWMGQIYNFLGMSVGCLNHEQSFLYDKSFSGQELEKIEKSEGSFLVVNEFLRPSSRKQAYEADITYGTNHEYGFDYLRDNLVLRQEDLVQRSEEGGHNFAIVDEADSILIDEARTPLIISSPQAETSELYKRYNSVAKMLKQNIDFEIDEKRKVATLTQAGLERLEKILGIDLFGINAFREIHHLQESLRANYCFEKDKDYVVKNGEVIIVDPFTGRLMPGRRWSSGLHQAIEAKEGVKIQEEARTVATITFQNYFKKYKKLAGMTGTAITSAEEFDKVYGLEVYEIPTNRPMIRKDLADRVYVTEEAKFKAILEEVKKRSQAGQPVLVGTVSISKNEKIYELLRREGVKCEILNAKNHEKEGAIIAQAGKLGQVTVATNMAGRGVDIILSGNPPDKSEAEKIKELGGLCVIGTERHESRRIDNQLRGRSGRQGDQGVSLFFVSLEDDLMRIFGSEKIKNLAQSFNLPEDYPIENKLISRAIESAQQKVEGLNFDIRKNLLDYDNVLSKQREYIYNQRREFLLDKIDVKELIKEKISSVFETFWPIFNENKENFFEIYKALFNKELDKTKNYNQKELGEELIKTFEEKAGDLGRDYLGMIRLLALRLIDSLWQEHLETLDYLRESVYLRAYGQRDPLVEYRSESYKAFKEMQQNFDRDLVAMAFRVEKTQISSQNQPGQNKIVSSHQFKNVGRNDPCPCGSGKKFKKCHGA